MTRTDRAWTAVIAECGLDRARPVLALLMPEPFARVDLARALVETDVVPDRDTPFAKALWPALSKTLGDDADVVHDALGKLPFDRDANPATVFWRALLRDLHGPNRPDLTGDEAVCWTAFLNAFRGRTPADALSAPWLQQVARGTEAFRDLTALANARRAAPLTALDRSLYLRFGWNDDAQIPGLTGLMDAAALLRTRSAWALAAPQFGTDAQIKILAAAQHMVTMGRIEAMTDLPLDVQRYGIRRADLSPALYPVRVVPPLTRLLAEAEGC